MKINHLHEGISDIVFHGTTIISAIKILHHNVFYTSSSIADGLKKPPYPFFFSTTRSKTSSYIKVLTRDHAVVVIFELNGRNLKQNIKGVPYDFFRAEDPGYQGPDWEDEMEDRIFLNSSEIPQAKNFIIGADIVYDTSKHIGHIEAAQISTVILKLKEINIVPKLYDSYQNMISKRKSMSYEEFLQKHGSKDISDLYTDDPKEMDGGLKGTIDNLLDYITSKTYDELSSATKSHIDDTNDQTKRIDLGKLAASDFDDFINLYRKRDAELGQRGKRIGTFIRKRNIKDASDFADYVVNKFVPLDS